MKHSLIPAVYLILRKANEILLLRRENTGYEDGNYSLVAGRVELGETFTQAMIREAQEEAGIILEPEDIWLVHMVHRKGNPQERIEAFFLATRWTGIIRNMEPEKCSDLAWFPMNVLPTNTIVKIRLALDAVERWEFYAEHGWE